MQFDVLSPEPFLNGNLYNIADCYSEHASMFNNRLHFHSFYEMSIIYEGSSDFLINGNLYTLQDRSIQLIRPSEYHRQQTQIGQHIRYYNIIFAPEFLTKQMQDILSQTEGVLCANLDEEDWHNCIRLAEAVYRAFSERKTDDLTEVFLRCNIENLCCCIDAPEPLRPVQTFPVRLSGGQFFTSTHITGSRSPWPERPNMRDFPLPIFPAYSTNRWASHLPAISWNTV